MLQDKQGICTVVINNSSINKYGESNASQTTIGVIDLAELNKYQGWEYWHKDGGIQALLYKHLFPPKVDSAQEVKPLLDTVKHFKVDDTTQVDHTFSFTVDQLYPNTDDRIHMDSLSHSDSTLYKVSGVVVGIYPNKGIIEVHETDGIQRNHTIHVYPYKASLSVTGELLLALRKGCRINSVCTHATNGYSEILVSAEITFRQ